MSTSRSPSPAKSRLDGVINHRSETNLQQSPRCIGAISPMRRNCMLLIIGALVVCSMILSLLIGHYHHNQLSNELLSLASSSSLHSSLRDFLGDDQSVKSRVRKKQQTTTATHIHSTDDERTVFESIIKRVKWTEEQCNGTPPTQRNTVKKAFKVATDLPMLPEGGVAPTLERWLKENTSSSANTDYPTCYLPPAKSCDVSTYTLIIMSHTTERLQIFMDPLGGMVDSWPGLTEVIIVWNSPRDTLTKAVTSEAPSKEQEYAVKLLQWADNTTHPLRIFFSLENGLTNNLLNRYHPKVKPKNEAVMYFDDDGPFWSRESMVYAGFELWKRNSNVQVGGFPRNVRFLSDRMKAQEKINLQRSIEIVKTDVDGCRSVSHPEFTPLCRNITGDHVEYNYFTFPDFAGHVLLPSGTFLHRNFLCFIWHPAFEELRQWVITHKTMPDDMTVSTLISHLSGRAPRTFPREVNAGRRRLSSTDIFDNLLVQNESSIDHRTLKSPPPDQSHRRLLWKQKNWGGMREEAINSILGYFGSIHPGTVGWCAGTSYMKDNSRGVPYVCHPEKPTLDMVTWLAEGGIGSAQCPLDPDLVERSITFALKENPIKEDPMLEFKDFCGECKYNGSFTCQARAQYLIDKYSNSPAQAKTSVITEKASCEKKI